MDRNLDNGSRICPEISQQVIITYSLFENQQHKIPSKEMQIHNNVIQISLHMDLTLGRDHFQKSVPNARHPESFIKIQHSIHRDTNQTDHVTASPAGRNNTNNHMTTVDTD